MLSGLQALLLKLLNGCSPLWSPRGSEVPVPRCPAQQVPEVPGSGSATVAPNLCNGQVPGSGSSGRWRFQVPGEGKKC